MHGVQDDAPPSAIEPGRHAVHAATLVAPASALALPGAQGTHDDASAEVYFPAAHCAHDVDSPGATYPDAHATHSVAPLSAFVALPARHVVHIAAPLDE